MASVRCLTFIVTATFLAGSALAAEIEVEAPGPQGSLRGTFVPPAPSGPIVLIIPGSGPTDRDGNNPLGLQAATYALLAEALSAHGIGSLRIDKRGMFGSAAAVDDANAVTIADYVSDVEAWLTVLGQRVENRCIWLLGHSEGGLVALAAAQRNLPICGLVLVAAPGVPIADVFRRQFRASPEFAPLLDKALVVLDSLEAGRPMDAASLDRALAGFFHHSVQGFLIDLFSYNPVALARSYDGPALVLQGARDLQIPVDDARRLDEALVNSELVLLDAANHVLKSVDSDDRTANTTTYADPALPLAPGAADAIVRFVESPTAQ